MRYILWSEGTGDRGLCRVLNWLLVQNDVYEPEFISENHRNYAKLSDLMRVEYGHLLVIHKDADSKEEIDGKGPKTRRDLVEKWISETEVVLPPVVIVIPVQMTESWLLICERTLREWGRLRKGKACPILPADVESQGKTKEKLKRIMEEIQGDSMTWEDFSMSKDDLWRTMERVHQGFSVLDSIPSYRRLRDDVAQVVKQNGLASL